MGDQVINPNYDFDKYGIGVDDIINEANRLIEETIIESEHKGLFIVKSANRWLEDAKKRPIPKMLFSENWYESELCILFADTNVGKSILAVQIGESISRGVPIPGFKMEAEKQIVLYFDFELTDKQFEARYSNEYDDHHIFDENFIRIEINPNANIPEGLSIEEYLYQSMVFAIKDTGAKILIVDNITYLKDDAQNSKDALPLMKYLKVLKNQYKLSILALAHTPKRDNTKPITENHIQGSKMIANFMDSGFAIGFSHQDKSMRYIKQIKARFVEKIYDAENVFLCQITKPHNFVRFEFFGFGSESEHLRHPAEGDMIQKITDVVELKKQGKSNTEIAGIYNVTEGAVRKWLNKANESGPE